MFEIKGRTIHSGVLIFLAGTYLFASFLFFSKDPTSYDHGNHLMITKLIAEGGIPYRDFSVVHPFLFYVPLVFGYKLTGSFWGAFLLYLLISALAIPLFYTLLKKIIKSEVWSLVGVFLLVFDPQYLWYSKVFTLDCLALVLVVMGLKLILFGAGTRKDNLLWSGFVFVAAFMKITLLIFFLFFLLARVVTSVNKKIKKTTLVKLIILLVMAGLCYGAVYILFPEMFSDLFSHAQRPRLPLSEKLSSLFLALLTSPFTLSAPLIVASVFLFSGNRRRLLWPLFFIGYLVFSFFLPKHFYPHHLIILKPVGLILLVEYGRGWLSSLNKLTRKQRIFASLALAVFLTTNLILWAVIFSDRTSAKASQIFRQVSSSEGVLFATNNAYYLATGKESFDWYYTTIPDGPCRLNDGCTRFCDFLARSDYALLGPSTKQHVHDRAFYDFLEENFVLVDFAEKEEISLYRRKEW